jgi:hypothetical protein
MLLIDLQVIKTSNQKLTDYVMALFDVKEKAEKRFLEEVKNRGMVIKSFGGFKIDLPPQSFAQYLKEGVKLEDEKYYKKKPIATMCPRGGISIEVVDKRERDWIEIYETLLNIAKAYGINRTIELEPEGVLIKYNLDKITLLYPYRSSKEYSLDDVEKLVEEYGFEIPEQYKSRFEPLNKLEKISQQFRVDIEKDAESRIKGLGEVEFFCSRKENAKADSVKIKRRYESYKVEIQLPYSKESIKELLKGKEMPETRHEGERKLGIHLSDDMVESIRFRPTEEQLEFDFWIEKQTAGEIEKVMRVLDLLKP